MAKDLGGKMPKPKGGKAPIVKSAPSEGATRYGMGGAKKGK